MHYFLQLTFSVVKKEHKILLNRTSFLVFQTFASWGIDMLKVDGCYASLDQMAEGYETFGFYLNATRRRILYSCSWPAYTSGHVKTDYQLIAKYCNIWRNYNDIQVDTLLLYRS